MRKAWLARLAEASKKATTCAQRGEAFETLMMAEWDGLKPDQRIRRVDRLINDAFLPDEVRYRNALRIPLLYVDGGQTNWNAIVAHLLRAVKAGDWSGVAQRRFRDVTKAEDLRLNALCEVASQMAAAGESRWRGTCWKRESRCWSTGRTRMPWTSPTERAEKARQGVGGGGRKRPEKADEKK